MLSKSVRPHVREVRITGGFWKDYLAKIRANMLPNVLDKLEESGYLENFRFAAEEKSEHKGPPFSDGLLLETMRGVSDFLAAEPDAEIEARLDRFIMEITAAADDDGFICTGTQCRTPHQRWGENGGDIIITHDLYDHGCLVEAGIHHYLATGKRSLLSAAVKAADMICAYIGDAPKHNLIPGHSLPEEAFVKLYRLMRDDENLRDIAGNRDEYLRVADFWYRNRGDFSNGRTGSSDPRFQPPYNQDHMTFADQREAVGHAVRAMLCYTGAAAVTFETQNTGYLAALDALWENVTRKKLHISGGIGTRHDIEGFDVDYNLPNDAYLETCAGVGFAFWNGEMAALRRDGRYYDYFEQALYNNVLASVAEDGRRYFYQNPLISDGSVQRWEWHGCPCCPPMLLKLFSALGTYIYSVADDGISLNMYIDSEYRGDRFAVGYCGGRLKVDSMGKEIRLRLRIPGYAENFRVLLNGRCAEYTVENGYALLRGVYAQSDEIKVEFDMPVRRMAANSAVAADRGLVAVMRGPYLYCAEGADNADVDVEIAEEPGFAVNEDGSISGTSSDGGSFTLIPYYRWNNRGAHPMRVWLRQENMRTENDPENRLYRIYR